MTWPHVRFVALCEREIGRRIEKMRYGGLVDRQVTYRETNADFFDRVLKGANAALKRDGRT
jgi:hypothetical protein